ncbi:hypothetical protein BKA65DRAFT_443950 [Rhexocercosporidium sp. MPI-PUGE-AT-0058]|nr:hypothetical protein BKA65DRAFT_443950 [Rhexocercosporidium sp. MPI-PUGE-AT-0058]
MSIQVVAILTPAPGKADRLKELLTGLADNVSKNEKDVSKYQIFEQFNSEGVNVFVVEETYDNQAAFDAHFKTEYFQAMGATVKEEALVSGPLDIKTIKPIGGFASR